MLVGHVAQGVGAADDPFGGDAVERLGPELPVLERLPLDAIDEAGFPAEAEAVGKVRRGQVELTPGFDGEYGSFRFASEVTSGAGSPAR